MADETPRFRVLLAELHGELIQLPATGVDDARRAQLLELKADIEGLLARHEVNPDHTLATVPPAERDHLQGRLKTFVTGFEGAHPRLASALEQTINALSNMGL